jgi:DNA primase large subunit
MTTATPKYPPCITHILDSLRNGEEISNAAKVLLLTYELANGKTVSDIDKMVGGGDLRVNTYQIEHLGLKGSSIVYPVPTCYKALHQNLCYATVECVGIKSPLEFGVQKL